MPSTKPIKIHLFHVGSSEDAPALSGILRAIQAKSIENRIQLINKKRYRLESLVSGRDVPDLAELDDVLCFNVMYFREDHGPGRADDITPLGSINYDGGSPGEDTAVLYHPESGYMAIQYAQNGPRHTAICRYINEFASAGIYELNQKFDKDFERKFQTQKYVQRIEAKIDTSQVTQEELRENKAAQHVFNASRELDGTVINISIGVDGRKSWLNGKAKVFASWLKERNESKDDRVVRKLETKGPVDDGISEVIDLLGGKLTEEIEVPISSTDFRMDIEDRWVALYRAFATWKQKGLLR